MVLSSLMLIYLMSRAVKEQGIPVWLYAGPVLVLVAGVVMLCMGQPKITDSMVTLITGIGMIVFSLSWFTASIMIVRSRRARNRALQGHDQAAM